MRARNKPNSSREVFLRLQRSFLTSEPLEEQKEFLKLTHEAATEIDRLKNLHQRLLIGAKNELFDQDVEPAISFKVLAEFLDALTHAKKAELTKVVKNGLRRLGIVRHGRDRRPGRWTELHYSWWVDLNRQFVEKCGIFSARMALQKEYPRTWQRYFKNLLKAEGWPLIDQLAISDTPTEFAMWLATENFGISYHQIYRACRRTKVTDRK